MDPAHNRETEEDVVIIPLTAASTSIIFILIDPPLMCPAITESRNTGEGLPFRLCLIGDEDQV